MTLASWPVRKKTHQITTYFDIADTRHALLGLSLRVRRSAGSLVQTLKADRTAGVAANRSKWEWLVEADTPDLTLLTETLYWQLPPNLNLQPVVVTTIDQMIRVIPCDDGTQIGAAFDKGMTSAGGTHQPVRELELRQGNFQRCFSGLSSCTRLYLLRSKVNSKRSAATG